MAFPTTGLLDQFDRADEGPPPSANWTNDIFGAGNNGLSVISNECGSSAGVANGYWSPVAFGPDCEVYCTVAVAPLADTGKIRLYLRLQNIGTGTTDGYLTELPKALGSVIIYRVDNAGITLLDFVSTPAFAAGDVLGFEAVGTALTVYKNGAAIIATTDATYAGAGYVGVQLPDTTTRIDNFGGGTIPGAATEAQQQPGQGGRW